MSPLVALWLVSAACTGAAPPAVDTGTCVDGPTLFGRPEAATGLDGDTCGPVCTCGGTAWEAPTYDEVDVAALLAWTPTTPWAEVTDDPYAAPAPAEDPADTVCAFFADTPDTYHTETVTSREGAEAAGGRVTHTGHCGVCSTLQDLAVYMSVNDLTEPVRACGLDHLGGEMADHVACLQALGFTLPCAQIWYWNTLHTQEVCLSECLAALDAPYNEPDGSLNPCLQCDEDESGPVFKAVAGRTRRNTGLPNAICRPCSEVRPITHRY